jgi:hypothetical protein
MTRLLCYLRQLLRELSDESAYERYLRLKNCPHSAAEWKAFTERRYPRKYSNAKCC